MNELLESVAEIISDYREEELPRPDADLVGRWAAQFDKEERVPLLQELAHILGQTYVNKDTAKTFLANIVINDDLTQCQPEAFWRATNFLDIQKHGKSQAAMLKLFHGRLKKKFGISLHECGGGNTFIYLDDALFTGSRIINDLSAWISNPAPKSGLVHIILMAEHSFGGWQVREKLKSAALQAGKKIDFKIWRVHEFENRKYHRDTSDVLWPRFLPEGAEGYAVGATAHVPRTPGGTGQIFSSEVGRNLVEQAFLKAGLKIRSFSENPSQSIRPLGFGPFGVGFGSLFATYRNCPNNAPLALWWGDPTAPPRHPFSKWQPLLPRKTYGADAGF